MSATHNKNAIQKICCTVVPNKDLGIRNEMNLLKFMPTYFIGNAKMTLFCIPKAWIIDPFGRFIPNTYVFIGDNSGYIHRVSANIFH